VLCKVKLSTQENLIIRACLCVQIRLLQNRQEFMIADDCGQHTEALVLVFYCFFEVMNGIRRKKEQAPCFCCFAIRGMGGGGGGWTQRTPSLCARVHHKLCAPFPTRPLCELVFKPLTRHPLHSSSYVCPHEPAADYCARVLDPALDIIRARLLQHRPLNVGDYISQYHSQIKSDIEAAASASSAPAPRPPLNPPAAAGGAAAGAANSGKFDTFVMPSGKI